jgi:hypothetical protein
MAKNKEIEHAGGVHVNRNRKKTLVKDKGAVTVSIVKGVKTFTTKDGETFNTIHDAKSHLKSGWDS